MQSPIPIGAVLQNRYRIIQILGQGGFGRTYLAEYQGRFNELCALKEFIPAATGTYALEKSKELFQREATILYQIQHPQVPKFLETFEQDQRLFLAREYVAGKTYRALLDERKAQAQTFSEQELFQLVRSLLPVLEYIHSRGIIHRDISPENLIWRESDRQPVLIDFGVVKEIATRIQSPTTAASPVTTVGKAGYMPGEQIKGQAYASSDLYALAVTAVVLLTGREPQELFNSNQLTWNWQQFATVTPGFAVILNRMLSHKPADRYQTAAEVAQAMQSLVQSPQLPTPQPPQIVPPPPPVTPQRPNPDLSNVQTMAVGRRPDPTPTQPTATPNRPTRPTPAIPEPRERSILDNPLALGIIGIVVVILAGFGSWALVNAFRNQQNPPVGQTFPSPLVTESPTTTPTETPPESPSPTPSPTPVEYRQNLNLRPGEATAITETLRENATVFYTFRGEQGQQLTANLADEGVLLSVVGPNQRAIENSAARVTRYQGTLPFTGQYAIVLRTVRGIPEANYKLNVLLENPPQPQPTPTATPTTPQVEPTTQPTFNEETITPPTDTPTPISGETSTQQVKRYVINLQEGQEILVERQQGAVNLNIRGPNDEIIQSGVLFWGGEVSRSGNYQIDVIANEPGEPTDFTLNVNVRNPAQ